MQPPKYPTTIKEHREFLRLSRRIDILKRNIIHPRAPRASYSNIDYSMDEHGTVTRNVPKKPSRQAVRKNTRRARLYAQYTEALAKRVA